MKMIDSLFLVSFLRKASKMKLIGFFSRMVLGFHLNDRRCNR